MFFQKGSLVQSTIIIISFWNQPIVTATKELEPIKGRAELAIFSYALPLPTKHMEVLIVIFSTQVEACHSKTYTISFTNDWNRHRGYFD